MNSLYLCITELCDMKCTYCYANQGTYQKVTSSCSMDYLTACKAIEKARNIYKNKLRVVFFGGEPLMNYGLIERIASKYREGILFCIITNGLSLNRSRIRFLVENNFAITVSFEGSKKAQAVRPDAKGEPSFERVLNNLKCLDEFNYPYSIRMTLYKDNVDIKSRLTPLLGLKNIHNIRFRFCDPVNNDCDLTDTEYKSFYKKNDFSELAKNPFWLKCRVPEVPTINETVCSMGVTGFAVDSEGYVYPCYRLIGEKEYCLGHIDEFSKDFLWHEALIRFKNGEIPGHCFANEYLK